MTIALNSNSIQGEGFTSGGGILYAPLVITNNFAYSVSVSLAFSGQNTAIHLGEFAVSLPQSSYTLASGASVTITLQGFTESSSQEATTKDILLVTVPSEPSVSLSVDVLTGIYVRPETLVIASRGVSAVVTTSESTNPSVQPFNIAVDSVADLTALEYTTGAVLTLTLSYEAGYYPKRVVCIGGKPLLQTGPGVYTFAIQRYRDAVLHLEAYETEIVDSSKEVTPIVAVAQPNYIQRLVEGVEYVFTILSIGELAQEGDGWLTRNPDPDHNTPVAGADRIGSPKLTVRSFDYMHSLTSIGEQLKELDEELQHGLLSALASLNILLNNLKGSGGTSTISSPDLTQTNDPSVVGADYIGTPKLGYNSAGLAHTQGSLSSVLSQVDDELNVLSQDVALISALLADKCLIIIDPSYDFSVSTVYTTSTIAAAISRAEYSFTFSHLAVDGTEVTIGRRIDGVVNTGWNTTYPSAIDDWAFVETVFPFSLVIDQENIPLSVLPASETYDKITVSIQVYDQYGNSFGTAQVLTETF